ncbi:MAG: hypothetical protein IPK13_14950 [Deltaproteobacteria bacterium]|nr:hypothetical protein [Deltaproteobacteria bacterium]
MTRRCCAHEGLRGSTPVAVPLLVPAVMASLMAFASVLPACKAREVDSPSTAAPERAPVAECVARRGEVRTHPPSEWVWEPVEVGARLSAGDWVRTATRSEAVFSYLSGSSLVVKPSAIVILKDAKFEKNRSIFANYLLIQKGVVRGKLEAKMASASPSVSASPSALASVPAEAVVVDTGEGAHVRLTAAEARSLLGYRLSARPDGAVEVAVTDGKGRLTAGDGRSLDLNRGQAQDLRAGTFVGRVLELPASPALEAPLDEEAVEASPGEPLVLTWARVPGAATYRVEVALDASFEAIVEAAVTAKPVWHHPVSGPGVLFWRVAARSKDEREGEFGVARRVVVEPPAPLVDRLVTPVDGATVSSPERQPPVTFTWTSAGPNKQYRVVVSAGDGLSTPASAALSEITDGLRLTTRSLSPGRYVWGVFALGARGTERPMFERPRRLTIKRSLGIETPSKVTFE